MKIEYVANDGIRFDNEEECKTYEERFCSPQFTEKAEQFVKELKEYCHKVINTMECVKCPFYHICEMPVPDWELR